MSDYPRDKDGCQNGDAERAIIDEEIDKRLHQPHKSSHDNAPWGLRRISATAAMLDLFSRRVVGWSMSATMTAQLVADALMMAIWRRGRPEALLHHSDRGSQYASDQFQRLMADHGIVCSMSRAGNVWDNAAMESFFSSMKIERTERKAYRTRDQAKADVFDYIERFYNPRRRHSTIGYLSPMEFERQALLA